ncbi:TraR/DksA family transcriptional regulator [Xenorhabdus bovienii]|uniref:Gp34 n=1 Tax=Xenorhabdus bovienii str. oregonense TaxID=1398202 RepID=A0A077NWQ0_XENBV|nr:TraR/DksA family transcriptional regulator [Xenorhabdus bovienii]MDE1483929.1 TraR/DksA family transcriptional regulator [Xenorhabdus bovienii]MDE1493342.1 TraR/DksA family transcriptional regulator [Xenorhabdus bovienii]MDE9447309.1 TraR/DksA family transcriptional regulator [Xenorhabdus bovienii]MDE9455753.1 TraR/DksA family transcriptional regulator [Xenorhabdus bovienii]MDE9459319.1 TraR/DksA family transcriptional regulator [Xenorhabdus bovienii]
MSKALDLAIQHVDEMLERRIAAHVNRPVGVSAFTCESCGNPIPEQRRMIIAGVTFCTPCQDVFELKQKHYRSE